MGGATIDLRTDEELVEAAGGGSHPAFEELYRRHAESAWGVAMAVTRDRTDAADAVSEAFVRLFKALEEGRLRDVPFRPYLLTSTRNAAIDILRRSSRMLPTDDVAEAAEADAGTSPGPSELAIAGADAALVARAFSDLPERWRSVLWLTEVEGLPARRVADMLGITANGVSQLAVRARAGLRERFLQAHVAGDPKPACRFTIDHLGAYVGGGISSRDLAKVDQHLAHCEACRARKEQLEEVGSTLRRAIVPLPLFLGATIFGRMRHASASTATGAGLGPVHRAIAGAAAGLLVLGVVVLGVKSDDGSDGPTPLAADGRTEVHGFHVTRDPEVVSLASAGPGAAPPAPVDLAAAAPPAPPEVPFPAPEPADGPPAAQPAPATPVPAAPPRPVIGDAVAEDAPPAEAEPVVVVAAGDGTQGVAVEIGGAEPLAISTEPRSGVSVTVAGTTIALP